ncbi:MAG: Uma2 family endonuclease [Chloroflexota bacterium]
MAVQKQRVTLEEFEHFIAQPENADRLFELINGEIVEKMPTEPHGIIAGNIFAPLWNFVHQHKLGRAVIEVRHRVPTDEQNDLIPDLSFTSNERALPVVARGAVPQMPDLVVEIKSPDDSYLGMREKALYYLKNGSRMVILAFPNKHQLEIHTEESVMTLGMDDMLDGGDVLPGFLLPVREIFTF